MGVEQSFKPANPKVCPCTNKLVSCLGRLSLNIFSYGIKRRVTVAHRLVQLYGALLIVCFVHRSISAISAISAICRPFQLQCLFSFVVPITSCNITQSLAFMPKVMRFINFVQTSICNVYHCLRLRHRNRCTSAN